MEDWDDDVPACHCGYIHYEGPCLCEKCDPDGTKAQEYRDAMDAMVQRWIDHRGFDR